MTYPSLEQLWSAFVRASKHAAADVAAYRHSMTAQPLEVRIRELAELSTTLPIAAFSLAYAAGLRTGIDFGRSNVIRERAERNVRRREREAEQVAPPLDPVKAKAEYDAAKKWVREMGRVARRGGTR